MLAQFNQDFIDLESDGFFEVVEDPFGDCIFNILSREGFFLLLHVYLWSLFFLEIDGKGGFLFWMMGRADNIIKDRILVLFHPFIDVLELGTKFG